MGRPGRGGGGGRRSGSSSSGRGGSSRSHSSGGRSSFSSSGRRSSYSSSRGGMGRGPQGGFGGPGPRPGFGPGYGPGPRPPRPPRRVYYRGGGSGRSGCVGLMAYGIVIFAFVVIMLVNTFVRTINPFSGANIFSGKEYASNVIDENIVYEEAQQYYSENFRDENHALLYYAYLDENESDCAYLVIGDNAISIFDSDIQDVFWEIYDAYYYSDVDEAQWLAYTFEDVADIIADRYGSIENNVSFDGSCYDDKLNWIGKPDKNTLLNGLKKFYEKTGIQPYIVLVDYETLPGVVISTGNNSTVLKTLIIGIVVIVVIVILFKWWKKVQQRKKEEAETTERILSTPLEKFGNPEDKELDDLMDKYDN